MSLLQEINFEGDILIIGGGNGSMVPFLISRFPKNKIHFLEASSKMIELAKKNIGEYPSINYYHSDDPFSLDKSFGLIILPFVLDCLTDIELEQWANRLPTLCDTNATVLITDFQVNDNRRQQFILDLAIRFFRRFTGHPNRSLADVFSPFERGAFHCIQTSFSNQNLLRSSLFKLTE